MSFSLGNIFGSNPAPATPEASTPPAPATPPAPVTLVTPGNIPPGTATPATPTPGTEVNGIVPDAVAPTDAAPDSPLDPYKTLWEDPPKIEGEDSTPTVLDPSKLQEIISKADLTNTVPPELFTRIEAGGEDARIATMEAMNVVAQQTLLQSTIASNKMVENIVAAALAKQTASLPDLIRKQATTNNLNKANPLFSNPAVKPVIEAVQAQLAAKNPTATADELSEMSHKFVTVMAESLSPKAAAPNSAEDQSIDWESFLTNPNF